MITVKVVAENDDLSLLVNEINSALWDSDNEMSKYDAEALSVYLHDVAQVIGYTYEMVDLKKVLGNRE